MVERTLISLPSQLQLIERLQHIIYLSSSLIFVSGEEGSGKSTLTENVSNALPSDIQQVYVSLARETTAAKLRQQIISKLFDKALFNAEDSLLDSILRLQQLNNKQKNRLIIIDNAKNLPSDFIIELCELFSAPDLTENNNLNVLLLGDEAVTRSYLQYIATHLSSRLQSTLHHLELTLPVLSSEEAVSLLLHNFEQVGYKAKVEHQDALNKQLSLCQGNPQKIIKLANDLSEGLIVMDNPNWVKTWLPAVLFMLLLVAIVAALAVYLYPRLMPHQPQNSVVETLFNVEQEDEIKPVTVDEPEVLAGKWADLDLHIDDNKIKVGLSDKTEQRVVLSGNDLIEMTVLVEQSAEGEAEIETDVGTESEAVPPLLKSLNQQIQPSEDESNENEQPVNNAIPFSIVDPAVQKKAIPITEDSKQVDSVVSALTTNKEVEAKQPNSVAATLPKQKIIEDKQVGSVAETLPIKKAVEAKRVVPVKSSRQVDKRFTADAILLAKNPKYFTLQISAMASRSYLSAFQNKYDASLPDVYAYQTVRQNKPWFVVIYGEYSSKAAANAAKRNLPAAFKGMPTWVKTWQTVHDDLRLNNE
jgi:DamX protein